MAVFPDYTSADLSTATGGSATALVAATETLVHTGTSTTDTFDDVVVLASNTTSGTIEITVYTGATAITTAVSDVIDIPAGTTAYRVYEGRLSAGHVVALEADVTGASYWGWVDRRTNNPL